MRWRLPGRFDVLLSDAHPSTYAASRFEPQSLKDQCHGIAHSSAQLCCAACTEGTYCPSGSPAGTFCPPGTVGHGTNLTSVADCDTCPAGHYCIGGAANRCAWSTYNPLVAQFLQTACKHCPTNAVTNGTAAISAIECVCVAGYYNRRPANETVECAVCPVGSECADEGTTLASLPLVTGYYRTSNASNDLRRCPDFGDDSGCVGGIGFEGPCKAWLQGPYCRLCNVSDTTRYYDDESSACLPCEGGAEGPMLLGGSVAVAALAAVLLWGRFQPHRNVRSLARLVRRLSRLSRLSAQLSLRPKGKQLLGFYQIATRVSDVYEVPMPQAVAALLQIFEVLNINVAGVGLPLQCLSLGTYVQQLAFTMLAPLVLAGAIVLFCVGRHCCCGGSKSAGGAPTREPKGSLNGLRGTHDSEGSAKSQAMAGLLSSLPGLLILSFLVFPMVSSAAFRAFSCEEFDTGRSYLRADFSVECTTVTHTSEVHEAAKALAWLGIGLYPVGISLVYSVLMLRARRAIMDDRATALSKALGFLVRDYNPAYLWWELLEAWKKLALVGFASLVEPGSIYQLVSAFLFSLVHMLLISVAMPFKDDSDNYFAKACGFALSTVFFFSVVLKVGVLAEAVDTVLTVDLRRRYVFNAALVSIGMIAAIVGALALATLMAFHQLVKEARKPLIRTVATKAIPDIPLQQGHRWHLFLSHIWGTGQDQCATIKRQLCLLLPDASIFLDVDDLKSIDALEEYVEVSVCEYVIGK